MRHTCAATTICLAASLGLGFGQDIPTETSKALANEWKTPTTTLNCLTALRLYTTCTAKEGDFPLSPQDAATAALKELLNNAPADDEDLYTVAQKRPDFLGWLTKANNLKTPPENKDKLLQAADAPIGEIYKSKLGKQKLAAVQESLAQEDYNLAIFQLLDAYPKPDPINQAYADALETLRACYAMDANALFKLVSAKILGPAPAGGAAKKATK
jgi:hypothetical protein